MTRGEVAQAPKKSPVRSTSTVLGTCAPVACTTDADCDSGRYCRAEYMGPTSCAPTAFIDDAQLTIALPRDVTPLFVNGRF